MKRSDDGNRDVVEQLKKERDAANRRSSVSGPRGCAGGS